jgi:hypothetical protein
MIKVKLRGVAVDALGNEQEVDVFLDVDEQSSSHGKVHAYGALDSWETAFVPVPPFDPYAAPCARKEEP